MSQSAPVFPRFGPIGLTTSVPSIQRGRGHLADEVMAIGAFIFLPSEFLMADPLRVPFALLWLGYMAANWRSLMPVGIEGKGLFLLPVLCMMSAIWAAMPFPAFTHGAVMGLGMAVAATVAARLDARQIVVAIFISQAILAAGSLLTMNTMMVGGLNGGPALIGVFPHKNVLAQRMLILGLAACVIFSTRGYRPLLRMAAPVALILALFLISQARAATAIILLAGALPLGFGLALIWRPAAAVRGLRPALIFGSAGVVTLTLLVLTNVFGINPVDDALASLGKDSTLTGRTVIWSAGNQVISENPLLGVGADNFWHADNPTAARLAQRFWRDDAIFWFHSAYYEVTVHLGFVGLFVALYVYARTGLLVVSTWWRDQRNAEIFFLLLIVVIFARSFVESELFKAMSFSPLLFWTAAFYGIVEKLRRREAAA
ncbi:MAG: O-antigen ligase family protein [Pseudomonadota bacterium]